ncbi:MAG: cysteine hydrolase [Xanthobacteraceae bacterium]
MVAYRISDRLVAIATEDRGTHHPWPSIPAARTALIVIDMQNYFMAPNSQGEAASARDVVPAINRLGAALRSRGGQVIWVQTTTTNTRTAWSVRHELLSPERADIRYRAMELGASGFDLWPTLDVRPEDAHAIKTLYSAFVQGSSDVPARLKNDGIQYVLIAGTYTNVCCQASAQDAMMLNFRTIMVSDCNAASTPEAHTATLDNFFEFFGDVLNSDEVIARLEAANKTTAA